MERKSSNNDLCSLVESIKSSDVVEIRVQFLSKLTELNLSDKTDLASLVQCLTTFWEDFTCLDISQCMVNKVILLVATKYVNSDLSLCFLQYLTLATKASSWCGKHLKMTLMSSEDSQEEEHYIIFFQLLLGFLSLSASIMLALTRYPVLTSDDSAVIVERFILEQLNLIKDVVSEAKKINSLGSEILKATQNVIDALMRSCKEYCQALNQDLVDLTMQKNENAEDTNDGNLRNHIINITKLTIEKLCELGILAANDGGSLVAILNLSWKGVVTLLQQSKGVLAESVSVQDIILTLISIVHKQLKCAAIAWSSLEETVSATEARRTFLPIKFYLINAVKICSLYPSQVYLIYREVVHCVLTISTFRILLSFEKLLSNASEMFSELVEKTSMDMLTSLLNSANLNQEQRSDLLDCLFNDRCCSNSIHEDLSSFYSTNSLVQLFSVTCETMHTERLLLPGRMASFHTILRYSVDLEEDVWIKTIQKLEWFLDMLVDEQIYSLVLDLQIPVTYVSGKTSEVVWQPFFSALLDALKSFTVVVSSSNGWVEMETFLLENLFHPHVLCWEVIMEIWCFLLRHGETDMVNGVINKLLLLMKSVASSESVLIPASPLRKVARTICLLLSNGCPCMADCVYSSIFGDDKCQLSSVLSAAMLLEGFPLNSLSDKIRGIAKEKIVSDFYSFTGSSDDQLMTACSSGVVGTPVFTLSASLHSHEVSISDVKMKSLSFLITILRNLKKLGDISNKEHYHKILNEMLVIISNLTQLYKSDAMEDVILELRNLFVSGPGASDPLLSQCKPYLAVFMGGLGDMEMSETDDCAKSCAVWELYHMLFKEQHWALAHLALTAFGYFAARTSCNQLWRFVPQDAALSYDLKTGKEASVERFMSELKAFLEKETAILSVAPSVEQLEMLVKEGMALKETVQRISNMQVEDDAMECEEHIDVDNQSNKRRKLPDGICRGMELLQNGLKVMGDGLSLWKQNQVELSEHREEFLTRFSQLEDVISQIVSLSSNC
ncbi:hypothetical protein M5689_006177 [Euphorbia peplus]|nr:hypothetical protein M5689_006177 [Euphorbia peplus]